MTVYLPAYVADSLRKLAGASNSGEGLSMNRYATAVLTAAVHNKVVVRERLEYDVVGQDAMFSGLRGDENDYADDPPSEKSAG